jgi:outer membrane protein OmpA-like peptidoglycan-associated protein
MRPGDFFGAVVFEYAEAPLVQAVRGDQGVVAENPVVDDLVGAQLSLGGAFHERIRMDLLAPVFFTSLGPDERAGPAMGDIRLSTMISILPPEDVESGAGGFGLGVMGHLDVPSGDASRFLGRGSTGGGGKLAATYEFPGVTLTADAGVEGSPEIALENLQGGAWAVGGFGIGVLAGERTGLTLEGIAKTPMRPSTVSGTGLRAEGVLSVRGSSPSGVGWVLGGAAGLTEGAGVPSFRAFLGFGFGHHEPRPIADVDTEGGLTVRDGCPLQLETVNGYKDEDGCPDQLGALSIDVRYDGRSWPATVELEGPDGVEILDVGVEGAVRDKALPGTEWRAVADSGDCLRGVGRATVTEDGTALVVEMDRVFESAVRLTVLTPAGEPVPEARAIWQSDETPHCVPTALTTITDGSALVDVGPGEHRLNVSAEGFSAEETVVEAVAGSTSEVVVLLKPTRVRVEAKRIVILEKVFFETGKAVIKPESFPLLDEVATTIATNPQIGRIQIGGHTDNQGSESYNQRLSQQRADSVKEYLVAKGVPAVRLIARGFGESSPIDTNRTPTGREVNRRVEFDLLDPQPGEDSP